MFNRLTIFVFSLTLITVFATSVLAAVPQTLSYQGRLTDAGGVPVPDAAYLVKFIIYNDPVATGGGSEKWNSGFQTINTADGLFSYDLGSFVPIPDDLFIDTLNWLGVTIGVDPEISPRTMLTSKGYTYHALRADSAGTLGGQSPSYYLSWTNLTNIPPVFSDGTDDTTSSLAWSALTSVPSGFADGVDNDAGGDITGVTAGSGLTGGGTSGAVTVAVGTNAITASHIAANAVGNSEMDNNSVGSPEIIDGSIRDADILSGANIAVTKISGTAVNLSSTQTITGQKSFTGLVSVGTTIPSAALDVEGLFRVGQVGATIPGVQGVYIGFNRTGQGATHFMNNVGTGIGGFVFSETGSGGGVPVEKMRLQSGRLTVQNDICYTNAIYQCSDARYKTDVHTIKDALDKIKRLRGVRYRWRRTDFPEKSFDERVHLGFIAQEVGQLFSEVVTTNRDGFKLVDYGVLTTVLVEAIKEQQNTIEDLTKQVTDMQAMRSELTEVKAMVLRLTSKQSSDKGRTYSSK